MQNECTLIYTCHNQSDYNNIKPIFHNLEMSGQKPYEQRNT